MQHEVSEADDISLQVAEQDAATVEQAMQGHGVSSPIEAPAPIDSHDSNVMASPVEDSVSTDVSLIEAQVEQQVSDVNEQIVPQPVRDIVLESVGTEKKNISEAPDALPRGWNAQVLELDLSGMTLNFMLNSVVELAQPTVKVFIESGHFRLFNENHEKRVRESLLSYFQDCSDVEFIEGLSENHETPMMWRERKLNEKKLYAKELIFNDPYVKEIVGEFQAHLIEQSIQPEI